jgi:Na+/melibiose symporter-like transporter
MGGTIIAMIIMWNYSITEGKANEIKEILTKRKNEKSTK